METWAADRVWPSPAIGVVVHEAWRLIDRWWTDAPIAIQYRDATHGGRRRVERRQYGEIEWTEIRASTLV